ncbi:hypothetical protein CVT25_011135 [Psilocybe cyanescens]|uniref:Uncharacterized protein n=1 Tax=Psilocybe cyanescens TaxID=93625 RepID=A0A409WGZ5_PSICY|nr:hypothetical protein CVT25_011135 [Psilocybe cyanescens]
MQSDSFNIYAHSKIKTVKSSVQQALDVNKRLQLILTERAEQLENELKEADQLLDASNADEGDDDPEAEVLIPGAKKPAGLFASSEFLNASSPFYDEAQKRSTYIANTAPHPMKAKDLETLANAVRQENERLQAYARLQSHVGSNDNIDLINNVEGLDWTRIAEKVSGASSVRRTPTECRITWIGDRHPRINHAEWTTSEVGKLNAIISEYIKVKKPVDWVKVAETLQTSRTPIDCMRHGLPPHRHNWTPEADQKLIKAVQTCGIDNWQLVARNVSEYATAGQCQGRWQKTLNPALRRGTWTEEEDELLRKAVAGYGKLWTQVSTVIPGRTNDQCRERWTEHVNLSSAKITWSEAEDKNLIELVEELGKQWKSISLRIGGNKTGQNCRMRYDKLKRTSVNSKSTTQGTSSLSAVDYVGPASNNAGPSRLDPAEYSEPGSSTFTFFTNLGLHSFSQTSDASHTITAAVDTSHPESQAVQKPNVEVSVPLDDTRGPRTSLTESTELGLTASNQLCSAAEPETIFKKPRKKTTKTSLPDSTNSKEVATTKPRPRPRPRAPKKAAQATRPLTADLVEDGHSNITSVPASTADVSTPATSKPVKPPGAARGRKRKNADGAELEIDKPPQKKVRTSKSTAKPATDSMTAISLETSNNPADPETVATTIDMRTDTASQSGNLDSGGDTQLEPEDSKENPPLRRGRSRRLLPEKTDNTPIPPAPSSPSAVPADLTPKRPRGRPRKVQTSA